MNRDLPSPELLRKLLRYDPETGKLFWKPRNERVQWDARWAGKEAFTNLSLNGYKFGRIYYKGYFAHRVAWAISFQEWPNGQIDHINGIRHDNRIKNLRVVSQSDNSKNSSIPSHNSSGFVGVSWCKKRNCWEAHIGISVPKYVTKNGKIKTSKKINLGYFKDLNEAIKARKLANEKYGFMPNHGRKRRYTK